MSLLDFAYLGALTFTSPLLLYKAVTRPRHLTGLRERLWPSVEPSSDSLASCIWVHGVSVGEIVAAGPLVNALEHAFPGREIVVSATTATGHAVARRKFPGKRVCYFPLDFTWAVRRVFDALRPSLVVLVELELWPNFLACAHARDVPVVVVNGRISQKSFRGYKVARRFLPLGDVARYCVQTEQYARRFRQLGVDPAKITVTGSLKYDGMRTSGLGAEAAAEIRRSLGLFPDEVVWIAGSTHFPEEQRLIEVFARLREGRPNLRLVLAPRHNERASEVHRSVEAMGLKPVLRSGQNGSLLASQPRDAVVIVDTLGELSRLYAAADLVFVGGSLIPHGGQNILEPAALGKPVIFGPHVQNFQESVDRLLAARGAVQVEDAAELETQVRALLADPQGAAALGARAVAAIEAAKGATESTIACIKELTRAGTPSSVERRALANRA